MLRSFLVTLTHFTNNMLHVLQQNCNIIGLKFVTMPLSHRRSIMHWRTLSLTFYGSSRSSTCVPSVWSSGYAGMTLSETQKLSTGPAFHVFGMSSPGDETHCSAMWWDSMTTRQDPGMTRQCELQKDKRRALLSFGVPKPKWPTTFSKPCAMGPVTALKSPSGINSSCKEMDWTTLESWWQNWSLSRSGEPSFGA